MNQDEYAKWLLEGKSCENCLLKLNCELRKTGVMVCEEWIQLSSDSLFKIVRPSLEKHFEEYEMDMPDEGIFHIEPVIKKKRGKNDKEGYSQDS